MPSLTSALISPGQALQISDSGEVLDHTVLGIWPLGYEASHNFCEGSRSFLAPLVACQFSLTWPETRK